MSMAFYNTTRFTMEIEKDNGWTMLENLSIMLLSVTPVTVVSGANCGIFFIMLFFSLCPHNEIIQSNRIWEPLTPPPLPFLLPKGKTLGYRGSERNILLTQISEARARKTGLLLEALRLQSFSVGNLTLCWNYALCFDHSSMSKNIPA